MLPVLMRFAVILNHCDAIGRCFKGTESPLDRYGELHIRDQCSAAISIDMFRNTLSKDAEVDKTFCIVVLITKQLQLQF